MLLLIMIKKKVYKDDNDKYDEYHECRRMKMMAVVMPVIYRSNGK